MDRQTVILFTRNGLGDAPPELQSILVKKFLALLIDGQQYPARLLFYTDGVKLACEGSPVLDLLKTMEANGVDIILCSTCLSYYGLTGAVKVGIVGSMADIIEAMQKASKVISV